MLQQTQRVFKFEAMAANQRELIIIIPEQQLLPSITTKNYIKFGFVDQVCRADQKMNKNEFNRAGGKVQSRNGFGLDRETFL